MFRKMLSASKSESGFTLIELMVVVVIIGVLVAIAIPIFVNATSNAKQKTCQANLRTIDGAISVYYANNSGYPANIAALVTDGELKKAPTEPFTGAYSLVGGSVASCSIGHTY
jgi:type II secretion system protein G